MQIELKITANSPAEMIKVLEAFDLANRPVAVEQPVVEQRPMGVVTPPDPPVAPAKRGRPFKKVEPVAEAAKPNGGLKLVQEEPELPVEITMADIRNALTRFLAAHDEAAATALLKKHGHTDRLSTLDKQHYPAVYAAAMMPVVKTPGMFDDDVSDVGA